MEFKNNTKHRYKTIQGLRSFKNTLPKNIKKIISKKGHIYSETLDNWRYIVGDELFKVCFPKSYKNSNRLMKDLKIWSIAFRNMSYVAERNFKIRNYYR